jgi:hypothetical protein
MKKILVVLLIIGFWLTCGYYAHGYCLGYFTHRFPYFEHNRFATTTSYLFGPFALIVELIEIPKYYLQKPLTKEEAWQAYHEKWSNLTRQDFEEDYDK